MIRFYIRAIGKLKDPRIKSIMADYLSQIEAKIDIQEMDIKRRTGLPIDSIKKAEAEALLCNLPDRVYKIALDENGELLSSKELAKVIASQTNKGISDFIFFIGGADGLHSSVKMNCNKIISFGKITLPHMFARLVLVEQIYRIEKIWTNHPYHK